MELPLSDFIIDFDVLTAVNDNVLVYIASITHIKYCTMRRTKRRKKNTRQPANKRTYKTAEWEHTEKKNNTQRKHNLRDSLHIYV